MDDSKTSERSELVKYVLAGMAIGAVILAVALPWMRAHQQVPEANAPARVAPAPLPRQLPDFRRERPSADARLVANWAFYTGDAQGKAVVILDKKAAKVYAFTPQGKLIAATPALLGAAPGDDSAPGIGDKPLNQIQEHEKTTPAGRFVAQPGINTSGEDIVWVDYDAAVSMHRVRAKVAAERRLERLASPTEADNRISFGCINLPVAFYENVLSPTVKRTGAIVYVLPETRTPQEVFGSYDVTDAKAVASARRAPERAAAVQAPREARREREL